MNKNCKTCVHLRNCPIENLLKKAKQDRKVCDLRIRSIEEFMIGDAPSEQLTKELKDYAISNGRSEFDPFLFIKLIAHESIDQDITYKIPAVKATDPETMDEYWARRFDENTAKDPRVN